MLMFQSFFVFCFFWILPSNSALARCEGLASPITTKRAGLGNSIHALFIPTARLYVSMCRALVTVVPWYTSNEMQDRLHIAASMWYFTAAHVLRVWCGVLTVCLPHPKLSQHPNTLMIGISIHAHGYMIIQSNVWHRRPTY